MKSHLYSFESCVCRVVRTRMRAAAWTLIVLLAPALPIRAQVATGQRAPAVVTPAATAAIAQAAADDGQAARARAATRAAQQQVLEAAERARLEFEAVALARATEGQLADVYSVARAEAMLAMAQAATTGKLSAAGAAEIAEQARAMVENQFLTQSSEQALYARGKSALDRSRWTDAVETFSRVVEMKGQKADGALYWKAYAQNRLGQRAEALATLGEMQKGHPKSSWLSDARALEVEVRQATGQPVRPEAEMDEDIKLIALTGLLESDPERSIPMLEKVLQGSSSPRVKSRALFVLAQSRSPKSREILARAAKGGMNPDLQLDAVKYLGIHGGPENRQLLADLYAGTSDIDVKRQILRSFAMVQDRDRLLGLAKTEKSPELRAEAVRQLGMVKGGQEDLYQLYRADLSAEVRQQIISAMMMSRSLDHLLDIARTEKDAKLRAQAIRNLGMMGGRWMAFTTEPGHAPVVVTVPEPRVFDRTTGKAGAEAAADKETAAKITRELVAIYKADKDADVRKAVVNALYMQRNATALVEIARAEVDPELKKDLVQKLSTMKSKEATDYLMELLVK